MDKERIKEMIEKLENISDELYKGNIYIGIAEMNQVIPDIAVAASFMNEEKRNELVEEALKPLCEAMQENDGAYIADLINYELIDRIKSLNE